MLVELRLVEQRYQAVLEVLEGASVTGVAKRSGVTRQTVHVWLNRYAAHGLSGFADKGSKPLSCPHQMVPEIEARIVELTERRSHGASWVPCPKRCARTCFRWPGGSCYPPARSSTTRRFRSPRAARCGTSWRAASVVAPWLAGGSGARISTPV